MRTKKERGEARETHLVDGYVLAVVIRRRKRELAV
jgi:hypothetical protein